MAYCLPRAAILTSMFVKWMYILFVLLTILALHGNSLYSSSLAFYLNNDILKYTFVALPGKKIYPQYLTLLHVLH